MTKSSEWLDVVWSLTILNRVTSEKISSVLDEKFHLKLAGICKLFKIKLKLN